MRNRKYSARCVLSVLILILPARSIAMDLPHYKLDSLVYSSTDIVIADLSRDTHGDFTATVRETLYGTLQPGTKLATLTPFLTFYTPLGDAQKVILFLDRRPHLYDYFHQDAAKSPFAVPPSGVYLIDEYGHVHEYFQPNNPGPYVAEGYSFFMEERSPTEKDDLALPSLDETRARIAATVRTTIPIRSFLERPVTGADGPALTSLLNSRPRFPETCTVERYDAIAADIVLKVRSLNDPELSLSAWHLDPGIFPLPVRQETGTVDSTATAAQVKFLIGALGDRNRDISLRIAAMQILSSLSSVHSSPNLPLPSYNAWMAPFADEVAGHAKTIFEDPTEDPSLRALCVRFFDFDDSADVADMRRVYADTRSPRLQFGIEQALIEHSDNLYLSLHPASGSVASIVELAPEHGCAQPPYDQLNFAIRFQAIKAYNDRGSVVSSSQIILKNIKSDQNFVVERGEIVGGEYGVLDGILVFQLRELSKIPEGTYTLGMEYAHQFGHLPSPGEVQEKPNAGHTITVTINDSPQGKRLTVPLAEMIRPARSEAEPAPPVATSNQSTPNLQAKAARPKIKGVVYTVTGQSFPGAGPQHTETLQFTVPNFITSAIDLSVAQLDSCVNCIQSGTAVQFFPNGTLNLIVPADSVHFTDADRVIYGWVFPPGAFAAAGKYSAFNYPPYIVNDVATMTVSVIPTAPEAPTKTRSLRCVYLWKCGAARRPSNLRTERSDPSPCLTGWRIDTQKRTTPRRVS
jgi:hypothetical protein